MSAAVADGRVAVVQRAAAVHVRRRLEHLESQSLNYCRVNELLLNEQDWMLPAATSHTVSDVGAER